MIQYLIHEIHQEKVRYLYMGKSEEEARQNRKKRRIRKALAIISTITFFFFLIWIFLPRSDKQIYKAVFGAPITDCVSIINTKDHKVPIFDCCIWIHFKACPEEINKIIHGIDTTSYKYIKNYSFNSGFGEKPSWWAPEKLGDDTISLCYYNPDDAHYLIFHISNDSTEVYYQDLVH